MISFVSIIGSSVYQYQGMFHKEKKHYDYKIFTPARRLLSFWTAFVAVAILKKIILGSIVVSEYIGEVCSSLPPFTRVSVLHGFLLEIWGGSVYQRLTSSYRRVRYSIWVHKQTLLCPLYILPERSWIRHQHRRFHVMSYVLESIICL